MSPALILLLAGMGAPPDGDSDPKPAEEAPRTVRVIDPTYVPQVGDRASVDTGMKDEEGDPYVVVAAVSVEEFVNFLNLTYARVEGAIDKLEQAKKVVFLDAGTEVLVTGLSPVDLNRIQMPRGIAVRRTICAEIRVLTGEHKGKVLYALMNRVVRYASVPLPPDAPDARPKARKSKGRKKKVEPAPAAKPADAKPVSDATRAASMLKLGQNLEKAGKLDGALEFYRKVVKQFPTSVQATTAAERIKALGKGS